MGEDRSEGAQAKPQPRYLTVGEAAMLLGVHRNTIHYRIKTGHIKAHKVDEAGRAVYRIDADSLGLRRAGADAPLSDAQRPIAGPEFVGGLGAAPVEDLSEP